MNTQSKAYGPVILGMLHKLKIIQAISSNIANAKSLGYQRQIPEAISFQSVLSNVSEEILYDTVQGELRKTGNLFDFAIEGNAYFLIEDKDGIATTRNGRFHLDEKGDLVTEDNKKVVIIEKTDRPLSLAKSFDIAVNQNGEIFVGKEKYGRIPLKIMDSKAVRISQGFVEGSNVNLMTEMASLAATFRLFEASEKTLGMIASSDRELIDKYGRNV